MALSTKNRILKNTIYLYIRSFLSLLIKLYTARLVLNGLGIEEYGVYQVVGGLVAMFSFLTSSMTVAAQRFLSFEIGLNEKGNVQKVFSTLFYVHLLCSIVILIATESVGLYFIDTKINIGSVSIDTAKIILHFTALSLVLTINSVPYNSMLISKEDMSTFAYIDILGEVFRLVVALSLSLFSGNRLVYYSVLLFIVTLIIRLIYILVCRKRYPETMLLLVWDNRLFIKIISFSGWTTLSSVSFLLKSQGVTILLNMFLGPIVNAAVGIGNQVNTAVKSFSQNFQMAFMPLITKKYAEGDYNQMNKFVFSGAKLSTILMIILAVPVAIEADFLLSIWLVEVPPNTSVIIILFLIESVFQTVTCTGNTAIRATGNIRNFEICFHSVDLISLPVIYILLIIRPLYWLPFVIITIFTLISSFIKIYFIRKLVPNFNSSCFIKENFIKTFGVCMVAVIIPVLLHFNMDEGLVRLIVITLSFEFIFCTVAYYLALNNEEKVIVLDNVKKILKIN